MVAIITMRSCASGEHQFCPGGSTPPERNGELLIGGGQICNCSCHRNEDFDPLFTEPEIDTLLEGM